MRNITKMSILLTLCVLLMIVSVGCAKKAPEGMSQTFYNDMLKGLKELEADWNSVHDSEWTINRYIINEDRYNNLSQYEKNAAESIHRLALFLEINQDNKNGISNESLIEQIEDIERILKIEVNKDKFIIYAK